MHWHGIELESYFDGVAGSLAKVSASRPRLLLASHSRRRSRRRVRARSSTTRIWMTLEAEGRTVRCTAGRGRPRAVQPRPRCGAARHGTQDERRSSQRTDQRISEATGTDLARRAALPLTVHQRAHIASQHADASAEGRYAATLVNAGKGRDDAPRRSGSRSTLGRQMGNGETYDFDFVPT